MTTPTSDAHREQISQVARWRMARNLIAVYSEVALRSGVSSPPSTSFSADDRPEALDAVDKWFDALDDALPAANFRSALGAITATNGESALYAVAQHFMMKRRLDEESRKKIEFVLVQYFIISSPPSFHSKAISARDVAEVLHPLMGTVSGTMPDSVAELAQLANRLQNCSSIRELYEITTALESCKQAMGDHYYDPAVLVHITHAQHLFRLSARNTVRTSVSDLLRQLEDLHNRGVKMLDCRAAGMTDHEPVDGLILTWKGLGDVDIEYRIHEIAPALLNMEKVLADRTGSSPQLNQELASLRAMAEKLSAQLAAISQRVQRLEILVPPQGSTSAVEPVKWPPAMPTIPIAMRTAPAMPEPAPVRSPEVRPAMPVPQNGKSQA
ncbi:MAG: hypothetical protein ACRD3E_13310 [Terriglobales bacterium]